MVGKMYNALRWAWVVLATILFVGPSTAPTSAKKASPIGKPGPQHTRKLSIHLFTQMHRLKTAHPRLTHLELCAPLDLPRDIGLRNAHLKYLKKLKHLKYLNICHSPITNLKECKNLRKLNWLSLRWTEVKKLAPLKNLHGLVYLDLSHTKISSIRPLFGLSKLRILYIWKTNIPATEIKALKKTNPKLHIMGP